MLQLKSILLRRYAHKKERRSHYAGVHVEMSCDAKFILDMGWRIVPFQVHPICCIAVYKESWNGYVYN